MCDAATAEKGMIDGECREFSFPSIVQQIGGCRLASLPGVGSPGAAAMNTKLGGNRLYDLQRYGQSTWLECVHPRMLAGSQFVHLIKEGISGIDANSAGFAAAYAEDVTYLKTVAKLRSAGAMAQQIYEHLSIEDVRHAADRLRPAYRDSGHRDGYVSVDLSPALAYDADATQSEARRLWSLIARPNVMIKVPATDAGLVAIRRLTAAGINVNATLIFGTRRHRQVTRRVCAGVWRIAPLNDCRSRASSRSPVFRCVASTLRSIMNSMQSIGPKEPLA